MGQSQFDNSTQHTMVMMKLAVSLCILPALITASVIREKLPEGCELFTVGNCDPAEDEFIASYQLPNTTDNANRICQDVCQIQEGCNFFVYRAAQSLCYLYQYRYLDSCSQVGGVGSPDIDVCESALDTPLIVLYRKIVYIMVL